MRKFSAAGAVTSPLLLAGRIGAPAGAQAPAAPKSTGRSELIAWADTITRKDTADRAAKVAALSTKADAQARKAWARKTVLDLMGGLPPRVPLNTKSYGMVKGDGFTVERVMFDSQPGYHVTANVYLPKGKGPFAAVIVSPGHGQNGKIANRTSAGLLARAGIIALTYDIVGMGERLQYYDPDLEVSRVGAPTSEHSMAVLAGAAGGRPRLALLRSRRHGWPRLPVQPQGRADKNRLGALGCSWRRHGDRLISARWKTG